MWVVRIMFTFQTQEKKWWWGYIQVLIPIHDHLHLMAKFDLFSFLDVSNLINAKYHLFLVDTCFSYNLTCSSSPLQDRSSRILTKHNWKSSFLNTNFYSTRATLMRSIKLLWDWRLITLKIWVSNSDCNWNNFASLATINMRRYSTCPSTFSNAFWASSFNF